MNMLTLKGLVTVELFDERGKRKFKEVQENAVMNGILEACYTQARGQRTDYATGINFFGTLSGLEQSLDSERLAIGYTQPRVYSAPSQIMPYLVLTDYSVTPNAAKEHSPYGTIVGFSDLTATYSGADTKRGTIAPTMCYRLAQDYKFVCEFSPTQAVGTFQSICLANIYSDGTSITMMANYFTSFGDNLSFAGITPNANSRSLHSVSSTEIWCATVSVGIHKINPALSSSWQTTAIISLTGPTTTTLGTGSTKMGLAIIGSDMWLIDNTRLRRSVIPTDATYTALSTYSPVTGLTENAVDLTSDGTDLWAVGATKVFKISTSTGQVTSSWTHNMTSMIGCQIDPLDSTIIWLTGTKAGLPGVPQTIPFVISTGVQLGNGRPAADSGGGKVTNSAPVWVDADRYNIRSPSCGTAHLDYAHGPGIGTRALLVSPLTKPGTQALRVTYDLLF